jgi:hypothetical protein
VLGHAEDPGRQADPELLEPVGEPGPHTGRHRLAEELPGGVDTAGKFLGKPVPTGVRPRFTDRFDELGIRLSPRVFGAAEPVGARSW